MTNASSAQRLHHTLENLAAMFEGGRDLLLGKPAYGLILSYFELENWRINLAQCAPQWPAESPGAWLAALVARETLPTTQARSWCWS
mmetsp:Transcript_38860/g.99366  ORF Transcript_38860/g.99366 Transcript_38860/m.99366 type:complete len:87 (-) Transcript_38860:29-289(-)